MPVVRAGERCWHPRAVAGWRDLLGELTALWILRD